MKKNIVILGSTGSIGKNALAIIEKFPEQFKVIGLSANRNIKLLTEQIKKFKPECVAIYHQEAYKTITKKIKNIEILNGEKGIKSLCALKHVDLILNAIIGSSGLKYTLESILHRKKIALANKESYVMAGELINRLIKKYKTEIIPVDSEHSALFHLLHQMETKHVDSIILTASGGPFWHKPKDQFSRITLKDTLKHPTWSMGNKITVDSATMLNKGFEVIEAHHLFRIPYEKIKVIIHPQSIIHSMVQTIDGEIYSQMSPPDMKYAILNAMTFPEKFKHPFSPLNFNHLPPFTFQEPDFNKFPLLHYTYTLGKKGGNLPAALCIADDIVVNRYLHNQIKFNDIYPQIKKIVSSIKYVENPDLEHILGLEKEMKKIFSHEYIGLKF